MSEVRSSSVTVRFYNIFSVAPIVVGAVVLLSLIILFLFYELLFDRYQLFWSAAENGTVLRNFRITIIHCLLIAYAPTAYVYVIRTSRRTLDELVPVLDYTNAELSEIRAAVGQYDWWKLSLLTLLALLAVIQITRATTPAFENPWSIASMTPEVLWHRVTGPIMACWTTCFVYAVVAESHRLRGIASRVSTIDLLDLKPLKPFSHQALTNSLLILAYMAVVSLFSLEEGFGQVVIRNWFFAVIFALASLLLPVVGVRDRIRKEKLKEFEWCRIALQRARAELKTEPDADR